MHDKRVSNRSMIQTWRQLKQASSTICVCVCLGVFSALIFLASCFYPVLRFTAPVHFFGKINLMISSTPGKITGFLNKKGVYGYIFLVTETYHSVVLFFFFGQHFRLIPCWVPRRLIGNVVICLLLALSSFYNFLKECHHRKGQCGRTLQQQEKIKVSRDLFIPTVHQCGASVTALVTRIMTANSLSGCPHVWGIPLFRVFLLRCQCHGVIFGCSDSAVLKCTKMT